MTSMSAALYARYAALPIDATRIGRHLAAGRFGVGTFLQRYDRLLAAEILARPGGRERLSRGDSETYLGEGGVQVAWTVEAVVEGLALLAITVFRPAGRSEHTVAFDVASRRPAGAEEPALEPALEDLFAHKTPAAVWQTHRACLDLWDWNVGLAHGASGVVVHALDVSAGVWLVETPDGSFEWTPVRGRNLVAPASGKMPPRTAINALFCTPPEAIGGA